MSAVAQLVERHQLCCWRLGVRVPPVTHREGVWTREKMSELASGGASPKGCDMASHAPTGEATSLFFKEL